VIDPRLHRPTIAIDARLVSGTSTGDSTYWTGLLYGLARIDADVRVLLISNAVKPPEIPWCGKFEWHQVQARTSRWWSLVSFPMAARRLGAHAIHTQYSLSPLSGRTGITTVHDVSFFIGPEWFRPKDRFLLQRSVPAACRRAAKVITVSETGAKEIERFIPAARGKIAVTYNACPPWIQGVEPAVAREYVRQELGVEGPYLMTVGTRWPRKNMELAVQTAERLPAELPHRLVLTGKAGWGEQTAGSRGQAVGYVSNEALSHLYSAADLYLAPSRHEGFGIPLLEAFRCGCPVLCSGGGALPEVAGDAAIVQPSWSPEDWARTAAGLLADSGKMHELRTRGRERERRYTWEETARRTLDVYLEVMP
jgi:glycosyltransferase involved in cell wall biosynthesis